MILNVFVQYVLPPLVLAFVGGVFGVAIAIFAKKFAVKVDMREEEVLKNLPGYNCGACGKAGCPAMAHDIVFEGTDPGTCKPIKKDTVEKIREYLKNNPN